MIPRKHDARLLAQLLLVFVLLFLLWSSSSRFQQVSLPSLCDSPPGFSPRKSLSSKVNATQVAPISSGSQTFPGPEQEDEYIQQWRKGAEAHDTDILQEDVVATYVSEIMGEASNNTLWRLGCVTPIAARYHLLKSTAKVPPIKYLFAVDLHQATSILPTLLGSVVQVIRFLGPKACAVSIVEGRSTDGTYQILAALQDEIEGLGATFYLSTSDISPQDGKQDRFEGLAFLRNLALAPLVGDAAKYSPDAQVIFLNDVYMCAHDILELVYQQHVQGATMTCGMDWSEGGSIFYDIYVARSIVGETFWQIAQDGLWHFTANLFWADRKTHEKYTNGQPFQVYACWNGGAVISARPILERIIRFRRNNAAEAECYMGEPTLFAKDLWRLGLGKIQVVPTVNVAYDNRIENVKDQHGRVEDSLNMTSGDVQTELIEWQESPPSLVKCMAQFHEPYWVPST